MDERRDRTEKLLALLLIHSMKATTAAEKAFQLSLAGLSNVEIADLLDTSSQVIAQHLYTARKKKTKGT